LKTTLTFDLGPYFKSEKKEINIPDLASKRGSKSELPLDDVNAGDILANALNRLTNPKYRDRVKALFDEAIKFKGIETKPNQTDSDTSTGPNHIELDDPYNLTKPKP
jgi:hypothetical protein